jgi:putative membrane protein
LLQAALFIVTLVIVALPPVRRALTPRAFKRERVRRRALEQFAAKNLHLTRERTGVLIFVSFAEHMAELIADEGIATHVEPRIWDQAMAALTDGLRRGEPGAGLAAAIAICGEVLAERFPPDRDDNPDELPNAVVVLPRA